MKKLYAIATIALLVLASQADAQLFRRVFNRQAAVQRCEGGQCEVSPRTVVPVQAVAAEPVYAMRALEGKSFAGALQGQLATKGNLSLGERRLLRILNSPDSERRDRQVSRMERYVRAHLDMHPTAAVDWAAVDWPSVLGQILQLLLMLLPFFI